MELGSPGCRWTPLPYQPYCCSWEQTDSKPFDTLRHHNPVPDQKDYEVETLRRLFAPLHEKREQPSALKKIFARLCNEKVVKGTPKTDEAA
jgi:hypothetical protein